jgi:hypothetical protein
MRIINIQNVRGGWCSGCDFGLSEGRHRFSAYCNSDYVWGDRDRVIRRGCCTNGTGSFYSIDLLGFRLALAWSDIGSLASIAPRNVQRDPDSFPRTFGHFVVYFAFRY